MKPGRVARDRLAAGLAATVFLCLLAPLALPLPPAGAAQAEELLVPGARLVSVARGRTAVEAAGPPGGAAVVLIHGFGGSTYSWLRTLPALGAAGYFAAALDLKGFGLSDKSFDADYSHAAQAAFVAQVLDALGVKRATLVGHSLGGSVALHFAQAYPERVNALVLVSAAVSGAAGLQGAPQGLGFGRLVEFPPFRRLGQFALRHWLTPERLADTLASAYADPALVTPEVLQGYVAVQSLPDWDLALLAIIRDSHRNGLRRMPDLGERPVLLVWGAEDNWVPVAQGEKLREQLAAANPEWVLIEQAGHLPMDEKPAAFQAALLDFLARVRPADSEP